MSGSDLSIFRDRIAIVTGAASGIGRAVSVQLAAAGAEVVLADLDESGAAAAASAIAARGQRATAVPLDVRDATAVQHLIDETARQHGRLDYLFNNAGILVGGPLEAMSRELWERIVAVNLMGVIHGVQAAYPLMVRQGFGHIVNTASLAGLVPTPWSAAYSMTKHAVFGLSASLRGEAIDKGVKVSAVCPGFIDTGIFGSATFLTGSVAGLFETAGVKPISAEECARVILRGVARDEPIIVVTAAARLAWILNRLAPRLLLHVGRWRARKLLAAPASPP